MSYLQYFLLYILVLYVCLQVFVSKTDMRDPEKVYNKMTLEDLSSLWPDVCLNCFNSCTQL